MRKVGMVGFAVYPGARITPETGWKEPAVAEPAARVGGRIVVGVDGSPSSKAALRWAVRQARLTGAWVEAVTVWQFPTYYGWIPADSTEVFEGIAQSMLEEATEEAAAVAPGVKIYPIVSQGNAARVLLDAAKNAELLVVGSRGHGGFTEALLGSVGQHCVHHATCPVVIVRGEPGSSTHH
jgi:nucleotide-binding universal stress UspA family protein